MNLGSSKLRCDPPAEKDWLLNKEREPEEVFPVMTEIVSHADTVTEAKAARISAGAALAGLAVFLVPATLGQVGTTFEVDPCIFATAGQLQARVESNVNTAFPISQRGVTLLNPRVVAAKCPNFRTELRTDLRYRKDTAVGKVSTSGQARFGSPMVAKVTFTGSAFPPSPPNIVLAEVCLTDIRVLGLNLRGSPNWFDQSWLRSLLNRELKPRRCFSVKEEVVSYAQRGGKFKPADKAAPGAATPSKVTKSGSGQVKVPTTNVTVSETATTTIAIRGRPGADHPGTDKEPAPPGEKTESSFPPREESAPTKQGGVPDVSVHIRQDIMDYGTRYRAKITVENRGTAMMPQVNVRTYGVPNHHTGTPPPTLEQCMIDPRVSCVRHKTTVGPLAPGQKKSFHAGDKQARTTTLYVRVIIESNTGNNIVNRVLGPH